MKIILLMAAIPDNDITNGCTGNIAEILLTTIRAGLKPFCLIGPNWELCSPSLE